MPDATPVLSQSFVFQNPPFAECHAATLTDTAEGVLAAFFAGPYERHPDTAVWTARFRNNRWKDLTEVANGLQPDGQRLPSWNPVLYAVTPRDLILFYKVGPSPATWWGLLRRSSDAGRTWSAPERLPEGILGPIKNKPIAVRGNVLLCPTSVESEAHGWQVVFERTPDLGKTWETTGPLNDGKNPGAIQPTLLTLGDGSTLALCRTHTENYTAVTRSRDGGKSWSRLEKNSLPNPNSGIDGVTLSDKRHLLVYNHTTIPPGDWTKRSPLNLGISSDGEQWMAALTLESEPGEYSYPAIIQSRDGLVHLLYTWKRKNIRHVVVDPKRLVAVPFQNGNWPNGVPHA